MPSLTATLTERLEEAQNRREELMAAATTAGSFESYREEIDSLDEQIPGLAADLQRAQRERTRIVTSPDVIESTTEAETAIGAISPLAGGHRQPLSGQFLESADWRDFKAAKAPNGVFSAKARIDSPKVEVHGSVLAGLGIGAWRRDRGLVTGGGATSAGALIVADDTGIYDEGALQRELTVLDLITRGQTDSDTVEFVRATSFTNNAATVAEADSVSSDDDTGRKPQSTFALERVSTGVKTIAHWEAATRAALADAPQMRTLIDGFLRYGLLEELEDQVINGAGSGEDFNGLLDVATGAQAFDTDYPTTLRRAKTKVRTGGKTAANGIVLNPEDAEQLDIDLIDGAVSYYRAATIDSPASIWGLPIIESEGIASGTGLVADFRRAVLWDRMQTTIEATNGYMDFVTKNLVLILAELRAAFGVIRPGAFVVVDFGS